MTKVWAKIIIDHKVKQSAVVAIDPTDFYHGLVAMATALKIPTPIVTQSQIDNFLAFNILKLKPRDFLEKVPFDCLELNALVEK